MRSLLAALAFLATACCIEVGTDDGACVELGRCWEWHAEQKECLWDQEVPPQLFADYRVCTGARHEDRRCVDLGYTVPCERGTYFVTPGSGC